MIAGLGCLLTLVLTLAGPICAQERRVQERRITQAPVATSERKRVALVLGNSAYPTAALKNPVNDARAMKEALLGLGFEVTYHENLTQNDMKRAIRAFGKKISGGGVGLFYFAGHGIQVNGQNYLVPVDSIPSNADEVEFEAVRADEVLTQMARAENGMNIVILDACRNNPFTRSFRSTSEGLARMNAPTGTIIAYATAPGSVAGDGAGTNNSIYTQSLLKYMRMPGLSIEEVFKRVRIAVRETTQKKQTPWEESSLTGDFYFSEGNRHNTQPMLSANTLDVEGNDWERIKNSSDQEAFEAYLNKHPQGRFAQLAKNKRDALRRAKEPADPKESRPAPDPWSDLKANGIPFMVLHMAEWMSHSVPAQMRISSNGLEYREPKGGKESHNFSAPCGGFEISKWENETFKIKLTGGKENNLYLWGGEESKALLLNTISHFCAGTRDTNHLGVSGGKPPESATTAPGTDDFAGFHVYVAYKDINRLADAARIANELNSMGVFAGITRLWVFNNVGSIGVASIRTFAKKMDTRADKMILFYHDDLEGVAKKMTQSIGPAGTVTLEKTDSGGGKEFYLWLP